MAHRANGSVPRRASRLGSLASPTLVPVLAGLVLGTAFVTCEPPRAPAPDASLEDAGPDDAGNAEAALDAGADAYDGPQIGDPCTDSHDCRPPQMICCANICREPHLCL